MRLEAETPSYPTTRYMLKRPRNETDCWLLWLYRLGYQPIALSHRADWQKWYRIRNRDIVPLGKEFYRFTFEETDDFVTMERITEDLADRFTLSTDCARICPNSNEPRLMAEQIGDALYLDVVQIDVFSETERSAAVTLLPTARADYFVENKSWQREAHTVKADDDWTARSHTYRVLSIVRPQEIVEGHVVGWIELRLMNADVTNEVEKGQTP